MEKVSCGYEQFEHYHGADGSCPFQCGKCKRRLPGALGHGPPCGCGPKTDPFTQAVKLTFVIGQQPPEATPDPERWPTDED